MRTFISSIFLLFALVPLTAGCVDTTCDGKVISVASGQDDEEGNPCAVLTEGVYDYTACCPDGYTFLSQGSDGGVLCEQECGLGSTASVEHFTDVAFLVHNLASAGLDAVEDLNAGP